MAAPQTPALRVVEETSVTVPGGDVYGSAALPNLGFASGTASGAIRVRGADWKLQATLRGHAGTVHALTCGVDGELVSGSADCTVKVWRDNACVHTCVGHTESVQAVAVSPLDGSIVSGSRDCTAKVWSPSTGECVATLEGHTATVRAVCVLSNGDLVTASWFGSVRVWARGSLACTSVHNHHTCVASLASLPRRGYAVGGGDTGSSGVVCVWRDGVEQWSATTGSRVGPLAALHGIVVACSTTAVVLLEDGQQVAQWGACFPCARVLPGNRLAVVDRITYKVFRVVKPPRFAAIHMLVTAWELHGGVPPPHPDPPSRATLLARTLSLRRLCRPRGETGVGRALELVEPFGQAVVSFM